MPNVTSAWSSMIHVQFSIDDDLDFGLDDSLNSGLHGRLRVNAVLGAI